MKNKIYIGTYLRIKVAPISYIEQAYICKNGHRGDGNYCQECGEKIVYTDVSGKELPTRIQQLTDNYEENELHNLEKVVIEEDEPNVWLLIPYGFDSRVSHTKHGFGFVDIERPVPNGVEILGYLSRFRKDYELQIRALEDIDSNVSDVEIKFGIVAWTE